MTRSETSPLKFLVYASAAVRMWSDAELVALLRKSRRHNARAGITGMLLYDQGSFMQLIEGPPDAVDALYARIGSDPRHTRVTTILEGPLERRLLRGWSMGFVDGKDLGAEDRLAYRDFLREPLDAAPFGDEPHRALKLLLAFRKAARRA